MVTKVTRFRCDYCLKTWVAKHRAEQCERSHQSGVNIVRIVRKAFLGDKA